MRDEYMNPSTVPGSHESLRTPPGPYRVRKGLYFGALMGSLFCLRFFLGRCHTELVSPNPVPKPQTLSYLASHPMACCDQQDHRRVAAGMSAAQPSAGAGHGA